MPILMRPARRARSVRCRPASLQCSRPAEADDRSGDVRGAFARRPSNPARHSICRMSRADPHRGPVPPQRQIRAAPVRWQRSQPPGNSRAIISTAGVWLFPAAQRLRVNAEQTFRDFVARFPVRPASAGRRITGSPKAFPTPRYQDAAEAYLVVTTKFEKSVPRPTSNT